MVGKGRGLQVWVSLGYLESSETAWVAGGDSPKNKNKINKTNTQKWEKKPLNEIKSLTKILLDLPLQGSIFLYNPLTDFCKIVCVSYLFIFFLVSSF